MKITATTEGTEFNSAEWCEAMAALHKINAQRGV